MTDEALEALPAQLAKRCRDEISAATNDDATHTAQLIEQVITELGELRRAEYDTADGRAFNEMERVARLQRMRERYYADNSTSGPRLGG